MIIDDVTITIAAGDGGKGAVAFNKNMKSLGPAGGSGGRGGNVTALGVADISALKQFRHKKEVHADHGQDGRDQFRDGQDGKDALLKLPVGTVIHNLTNSTDTEVKKIGETISLAQGGIGGRGNFHFRSPRNTSPTQFQGGRPGEHFTLRLELKLIADVGFVGLPNAGKSSLLNALTNAQSKVGNYPFTTLEPSLGAYYELILADIPGLIEGSSTGRGLGTKFLRHIERTRILFHLLSAESTSPTADYDIIRNELKTYSAALANKPEYVFLTKSDLVEEDEVKEKIAMLAARNITAVPISIHDQKSLTRVQTILNKIQAEK